jgi:hypothetical protein
MQSPPHSSAPPPSSARVPQVRARHTQALLGLAEERVPAGAPSIAASLGAGGRAIVEAADPSAWIPLEIDVELVEVMTRQLGSAVTASLVDANVRDETNRTLLAGMAAAVLHAFAASPVTVVKQLPAGWGRVFRNAGWVEVAATGRSHAVARFRRLPAICVASAAWMDALIAGLRSLYSVVGATGTVERSIEDAAQGTVLVTFRWR